MKVEENKHIAKHHKRRQEQGVMTTQHFPQLAVGRIMTDFTSPESITKQCQCFILIVNVFHLFFFSGFRLILVTRAIRYVLWLILHPVVCCFWINQKVAHTVYYAKRDGVSTVILPKTVLSVVQNTLCFVPLYYYDSSSR